ncbi:hypothetical protein [Fictibacillus norfolkensis]|uniref:AAA+ ATPase domain-containing protein n=1 Tax=Fictibacillus norfolkensis TaxID=2762233 RepID=A0ABR8SR17_9BACL|nr:hypothetical protein [Fictibacillus norfolkensis]MBD7965950.1 hypothetical protein [Fictibacillus norfolkensis]
MLESIALSIATGIFTNLSYDALFKNDELLIGKVQEAYDKAKTKFYKKYGDQFGNELNSFLERQKNIDTVVKSLFYSTDNINVDDIDFRSFDGYDNPTKEAVIDFINILNVEMHQDYYLDKILSDKAFIQETKKGHQEIKQKIDLNNLNLRSYFAETLNKTLNKFKDAIGFDIALSNQTLNMGSMEPPQIVINGVDRYRTIDSLIKDMDDKTWFHIKGEVGSGKTQLLLHLSKRFKGTVWISLKELTQEQAIPIINTSLATYTNVKPNYINDTWYEKSIAKMDCNDIIIIDDLPNFTTKSTLSNLFIRIAKLCKKNKVKLVTAGAYEIGQKMKQQLGPSLIKSERIPPFNNEEIQELLHLKGAPNQNLDKLATWIAVLSKNNPMIVSAIAEYLSMENWKVDLDVFHNLQQGFYLDELITEIQNLLIENINDHEAKQLLYRLTLINDKFNNQYLQEISKVEPVINSPFEKFNKLLGYWITKDNKNYTVSPLVTKIGELNVSENVKMEVHRIIAKLIAANKSLNPLEVIKLITHLLNAKDYNNAVVVLLNALVRMEELEIDKDPWGITLIWKNTSLPNEIDYNLKVLLRVKQVMVNRNLGENVDYLFNELENLLFHTVYQEENSMTRTFACFLLAIHFLKLDRIQSIKYMKEALTTYDNRLYELTGVDIVPEEMIWLLSHSLNSAIEIDAWIDMLNSLTHDQVKRAIKSELTHDCCLAIANRIWLNEHNKKKEERNWDEVINHFNILEQVSEEKNFQLLKVCIARARIVVLAEYLDKIDDAEQLAHAFLSGYNLSNAEKFLIHSIIGKQFVFKNYFEKALHYFEEVLTINTEYYPLERIDALLEMSKCVGLKDSRRANKLLEKAIVIAEKTNHIIDSQKAKIYGEYSMSLWMEGKIKEAFEPLQSAAEILLNSDNRDASWKCVMTVLGHVTGYYSSMVSNGEVTKGVSDEGVYTEPYRGMFLSENKQLEAIFNQGKDVHLATLLFFYADNIKHYKHARKWLYKGYEMIKESRVKNSISAVHLCYLSPYLILEDNVFEAIDVAFEAHMLLRASFLKEKNSLNYLVEDINEEKILGTNEDEKNIAYLTAVESSIVPIMLYVCKQVMRDPIKAKSLVNEVVKATEKYSNNKKYSQLWRGIADLFNLIIATSSNPMEIMARFSNVDEQYDTILKGISYITVAFHCTPEQALDLHFKSILWIEQAFKRNSIAKEKIINNYYKEYWIQRYVKDRECFSNTNIIDEEFKELLQNEETTFKEILLVINKGFNLEIAPEVLTYLKDK